MNELIYIMKALAEPVRVRLLCALREGELCVCQLIELLELAPATVSKHLSILHRADLVERRKKGRWVYYRLPQSYPDALTRQVVKEVFRVLADDPVITGDNERLIGIRNTDQERLCQ